MKFAVNRGNGWTIAKIAFSDFAKPPSAFTLDIERWLSPREVKYTADGAVEIWHTDFWRLFDELVKQTIGVDSPYDAMD